MAQEGINLRVAVNIPPRQLADQTIFSDLKQALRDLDFEYCPKSLVRAIVAVAQALNLQVIAEGVESAKEDAFLIKNGVNERQRFLFAKPMTSRAFIRWYRRRMARK